MATHFSIEGLSLEDLPTMYDLPSEDPEEPGLPDDFHYFQPQLLRETFAPGNYPSERVYVATDLNLYYDPHHTSWHKRPDWFAVVDIDAPRDQEDLRWSYVIWQEIVCPHVVVELLSPGTEKEDLGATLRDVEQPPTKWEVYERILKIPYYIVFSRYTRELQIFQLRDGRYQKASLVDNRLWFADLGIGLGIWSGEFQGVNGDWLRWYTQNGDEQWVATRAERERAAQAALASEKHLREQVQQHAEQEHQRAEQEHQRAEQERQRAEQERQRAEKLAEKLRALGINPDDIAS